jgi:hypothetical protein
MRFRSSITGAAFALLFIVCAEGITHGAHALPPCVDMTINNSGGSIVSMRNGQTFSVFPGSGGRIQSWLPGDQVNVCPLGGSSYQITNLRKNQTVKALRR